MKPRKCAEAELPYGVAELDPIVAMAAGNERMVRCYVRGCCHYLRPPTRGFRGEVCSEHGIRCHLSGKAATYSYVDPCRNAIVAPERFRGMIRSPFKFESHRLGSEKSEDTVTWNVFQTLFEAKLLSRFVATVTGEAYPFEPHLYLWGIGAGDLLPWPLLRHARAHFEAQLPVERPLTEPDIALHLPGKYLILIEAKLTSPNTFYESGPRKDGRSLTMHELTGIYQFPEVRIVDPRTASRARRVPQQLWRNMVFCEWMAITDYPGTKAYHLNLVRATQELGIEVEFRSLLQPALQHRFQRITWETIQELAVSANAPRLTQYFRNKTVGLRKAFSGD